MIFFRCDVSDIIGWGHLKRCLILAKHLNKLVPTVFLMPQFEESVRDAIKQSGSSFQTIPKGLTYTEEVKYYPVSCKKIIIDLGHRRSLAQPEAFVSYLHELDMLGCRIVVIDGLDDESFRNDLAPKIKAYIQPYWGVPEETRPQSEFWFHGPKYVLVDEVYQNIFRTRVPGSVKNMLISFGGSDPQENTIKVLNGIVGISHNFNVRVIIGPSFSVSHIELITKMSASCSAELIISPKNLVQHYHWADLGICGSGTSRYEAAAVGLPIIFTSIYREHDRLSDRFALFGTSQYIGPDASVTPLDWSRAIMTLKTSFDIYKNMINSIEKMKQSNVSGKNFAKELKEVFEK